MMDLFTCWVAILLASLKGVVAPNWPTVSVSTEIKNSKPALYGKTFSLKLASFQLGTTSVVREQNKSLKCGVGKAIGKVTQLIPIATYNFSSKKLVLVSGSYKSRSAIKNDKTLEIKNVKFNDHGDKFFCELNVTRKILLAINKVTRRSTLHTISVEGKPTLIAPLAKSSYTILENKSVTIPCSFMGYPSMSVQWTWPTGVRPTTSIISTPSGSRPTKLKSELRLSNLKPEDAATYVCKGRNKHGSKDRNIRLVIAYPPRIASSTKPEHKVCHGETVNVICETKGNPAPDVELRKNGVLLRKTKTNLNFALNVTKMAFGTYTCIAKNAHGSVSKTINITAKDVDRKPPKITTSAETGRIVVTWKNIRCSNEKWNRTFVLYLKGKDGSRSSKNVQCTAPECGYTFDELTAGQQYSVAASTMDDQGNLSGRSADEYATPTKTGGDSSSFPIAAIAGGAAGAIVLVALIVLICCCRKKKKTGNDAVAFSKKFDGIKKSSVVSHQAYEELGDTRYVTPGHGSESVYEVLRPNRMCSDSLVECDKMELDPNSIHIIKVLNPKGPWNMVLAEFRQGKSQEKSERVRAIARQFRDTVTAPERKDVCGKLHEMASVGGHPNLLTIFGVVTKADPVTIVVEHASHGDLLQFLRKSRGMNDDYYNVELPPKSYLKKHDLAQFAAEVANAMEYLSSKKVVHSMLSALSVFVVQQGGKKVCKLAYYTPIKRVDKKLHEATTRKERSLQKWTAPEVLSGSKPTMESDIWSYGVVLFEIFTVGCVPYVNVPSATILEVIKAGTRPTKPSYIDKAICTEMASCWQDNPLARPSFYELKEFFEKHFETKLEDREHDSTDLESPLPVYDDIQQSESIHRQALAESPSDPFYDDVGTLTGGKTIPDNDSTTPYDFYVDVQES